MLVLGLILWGIGMLIMRRGGTAEVVSASEAASS
jgi:hypothetical protein